MKIVIDLQCCQTEAGTRGIGRYSLSLAEALTRNGPEHDFLFLLNRRYLAQSNMLARQIERFANLGDVVLFDYPAVELAPEERELRERIANVLRNDRVETLSADVYHVSSLFEGESVYGPAAPYLALPKTPLVKSATFYDLIPALYPEQYLPPAIAPWYRHTMSVARQCDVGLAISETTRQDAARLLDMPLDRIVNISGSVDDRFHVLDGARMRDGAARRRFDLDKPYILYVGGPDFRKNLDGALEAFANAKTRLDEAYRLVVVFGMTPEEEAGLRWRISHLGIAEDVILTGRITDDELVELYNDCTLFFFPSLYEGLGLPVIEAMRCGAPVLVGDNSSLREIVDDARYRFDASESGSMADSLVRALTGEGELARMRAYSRARAGAFSWDGSARTTLDAWAVARARQNGRMSAVVATPVPRIAMFTPLPPAQSGIADYSADFLAELKNVATLEVFVEGATDADIDGVEVRHHTEFAARADAFDAIVYQLGNSPFHHYMAPYIEAYPGVVVMHDGYVGHLSHDPSNPDPFVRQVIRDHGGAARRILDDENIRTTSALALIDRLTCAATHVYRSRGVIVHSEFARDLMRSAARLAIAPPIEVIPQFRARIAAERRVGRMKARELLGLPTDAVLVGSFGHVAKTKGVPQLIEAFRATKAVSEKTKLVFVGELEGGANHETPYAQDVLRRMEGRSDIVITGFVSARDYDLYLQAMDVTVQLRTLTRGETSRALLDVMWSGVPLIYNRLGASSEMPGEAAVALDDHEPATIAAALDRLLADAALRERQGRAGLTHMEESRNPETIARAFIRSVLDMTARAMACGPPVVIENVARLLRPSPPDRKLNAEIARAFVAQERSEDGPRLLIGVGRIGQGNAGPQRIVAQLTRAAYREMEGLRPQPFAFEETGLIFADDFAQECGARLPVEAADASVGVLRPGPFDKMLVVDGDAHLSNRMAEPIAELNRLGGQAYGLLDDILPLQRPDRFPPHVAQALGDWLRLIAGHGEGIICTSRAGADALVDLLKSGAIAQRAGLRIGHVDIEADADFAHGVFAFMSGGNDYHVFGGNS